MRNAVNKQKPVNFISVELHVKMREEKKHPFEVLIGSRAKRQKENKMSGWLLKRRAEESLKDGIE